MSLHSPLPKYLWERYGSFTSYGLNSRKTKFSRYLKKSKYKCLRGLVTKAEFTHLAMHRKQKISLLWFQLSHRRQNTGWEWQYLSYQIYGFEMLWCHGKIVLYLTMHGDLIIRHGIGSIVIHKMTPCASEFLNN